MTRRGRFLAFRPVPRQKGFDRLVLQDGKGFGVNKEVNAAGNAGLASDQSGMFEGENHLMD